MIKTGLRILLLDEGGHSMNIRCWMIWLSIGLFANPVFRQKKGDLAAFEKALAEIAAESPRKTNHHTSFYASIGHLYCQLKQVRGDGPLNIDDDLAILHQREPRTQQDPQDAISQGKAMEVADELLCP